MKLKLLALGLAAIFATQSRADDDAKTILNKAIEAHGGKETINKYAGSKSGFKVEMTVMGMDLALEGTMIYSTGKMKIDMSGSIMCKTLTVSQVVTTKGLKQKQTFDGKEIPVDLPDAAKAEAEMNVIDIDIQRIVPLLDNKKFDVRAEKDEEVDGNKAKVLVVLPKDRKDVKLFFDAKTGLLIKMSRQRLVPGSADGKEGLMETVMSDFKKIDGIMVPMKSVSSIDGTKFLTMTISDHAHHEKIDDKEFEVK